MNTLGWLFILGAAALIHGVKNGRGIQAFTDLSDLFIKAVAFDNDGVKEVWSRSGDGNVSTTTRETASPAAGGSSGGTGGAALLSEVQRLGKAATGGYSQAVNKRTGPKYYDCSGLVYRALKNLGYKVPPFSTATFKAANAATVHATVVTAPAAGDIVWWPGHMGVMTDTKNFYSALSTRSGIKTAPISVINRGKPTFYRLP